MKENQDPKKVQIYKMSFDVVPGVGFNRVWSAPLQRLSVNAMESDVGKCFDTRSCRDMVEGFTCTLSGSTPCINRDSSRAMIALVSATTPSPSPPAAR